MSKRVFLIVLDSFGIGEMPDAAEYGDKGTNTLRSISKSPFFNMDNLKKMGFFNIDGIDFLEGVPNPTAAVARLKEVSKGKDTTIGHWEIAGSITKKPFTTYTKTGFPDELVNEFIKRANIGGILGNKAISGTVVIEELGKEHFETGYPIVYTSADSTFQIAAHNDVIQLERLYELCEIAQDIIKEKNYNIGTVIARPFVGKLRRFQKNI